MTTAQELLVEEYMHIARNKAGKWTRNQNVLSYDELLSTAYVGLCKAAKAYDPARKCHFVGFASICIDNEIREELGCLIPRKRKMVLSGDMDRVAYDVTPPDVSDFEDRDALLKALQRLPADDRAFLALYYERGMTQRKLAEELVCSQKAVFSRLREVYDFLRFQMETI